MKTIWKVLFTYYIVSFLFVFLGTLFQLSKIIFGIFATIFLALFIYYLKSKKRDVVNFNSMSGLEFESYLEKMFRNMHYFVKLTPKTNDQGADLILTRDGIRTAVQAKRYSKPVGNRAVQEVISAREYYDCNKALVVTNNKFTKSAVELARRTNVQLWDGTFLKKLIFGDK